VNVFAYEDRKPMANWRRPLAHICNVWLSYVQEDADAILLFTPWRSEITKGAMVWHSGPFGLCSDENDNICTV